MIRDLIAKLPKDLPVLIAGPTASGKSALALAIAEAQGGVIVNADASQVYDCWRVLTARPSVEEEARVPHRALLQRIDTGVSGHSRNNARGSRTGRYDGFGRHGPGSGPDDSPADRSGQSRAGAARVGGADLYWAALVRMAGADRCPGAGACRLFRDRSG